MRMFARAPERSSPRHVGNPFAGADVSASGSEEITISKWSWMALASSTTRPSHAWGVWWSVPFGNRIAPLGSMRKSERSSSRVSSRRTNALASSATEAPAE